MKRLDQIRERLEPAMFHAPYRVEGRMVVQANHHPDLKGYVLSSDSVPAIAEFIAAAPTDITALLGAVEGVLALAEEWRYKGEFGWGAWQEGQGPDPEGYVLDTAAGELRAAITTALEGK